ncbi:MAG: excinuclease ABC subunit UvrA [Proteobacteria bacterium]|nr:excinuclease ABC subunit UvrA [Pseudomonadota bacterium]
MVSHISIKGARQHNLKNVSLDIPKRTLTVITGLSGSGKSSLAFDTLYAEGQRRFVESLSAYARQFLNVSNKPDVDSIDGLSPAIAIDQKTTSKNPRSTVGTITEIHDYLRLLYAQVGTPHCPTHDIPIQAQTVSQMVDAVMAWPEGTRLQVVAPVVRGRKGEYKKELLGYQKQGFTRVRINGETYDIADAPELTKNLRHEIDVIVDRLVVRDTNQQRLAESLETALKLAEGLVHVEPVGKGDGDAELPATATFSEKYACHICGHAMPDLEPRLFSFNSPYGACRHCDGLGEVVFFNPDLIVDKTKSLLGGAIRSWPKELSQAQMETLSALAKHYKFDLNTIFAKLDVSAQNIVLYGSGDEEVTFTYKDAGKTHKADKPFEGVIPRLERAWAQAKYPWQRDELSQYRSAAPCPECNGQRLNPDALAVKIMGKNIFQYGDMSIADAKGYFDTLLPKLTDKQQAIATPIMREVNARLSFLTEVGLTYLNLNRKAGTLSGGESQRIRLASQIGSGLTGVLYVLDEPSIGLHQRDNDRLLATLVKLRDLDNTVLVVEHDEDAIRLADHIIDMGPGAGEHGGQVVAEGTVDAIKANPDSITGAYLRGERAIAVPAKRRKPDMKNGIKVIGATGNNLKDVTVTFPLGVMTCVTGVSGSGKSTLVLDTLYAAAAQSINGSKEPVAPHKKIDGLENVDKVVDIDQSPIGRTPRSNPATYTGIMSPIRDWFTKLPESRARGYAPGRFSFNVKGGRCEACQGEGLIKVEMHFLSDVYVPCDVCHGKRFNRETLEVKYRDKSIADVLDMTVEEGVRFFQDVPAIATKLQTLMDVGLSYIRLGQPATTLSGGEAQRVKLSKELSKRATGKTLYILDEPTTGLHFADIDLLLKVLHRLVDEGNTMIIIEHNLDVIKTADWLVDVGPEGGAGGGTIVAEGTPEEVTAHKDSYTGIFLKKLLTTKKDKVA